MPEFILEVNLALAILSVLSLLGSLGVLWIVMKLYTEIVKYKVLDPRLKGKE